MFSVSRPSFRVSQYALGSKLQLLEVRGFGVGIFEECLQDANQLVHSLCRFQEPTRIFDSQVAAVALEASCAKGRANHRWGSETISSNMVGGLSIKEPCFSGEVINPLYKR